MCDIPAAQPPHIVRLIRVRVIRVCLIRAGYPDGTIQRGQHLDRETQAAPVRGE